MSALNLLLIDDDLRLGKALKEYLEKYGHSLVHASHPSLGLELARQSRADLIILDIMMPDIDGFQVCREIRSFSNVPVLFLSARGETTDRIVGLELGADDYLPKPFEPRELLARIESIHRRSQMHSPKINSDLVLDSKTMEATLLGKNIDLTSMEFQALHFLKMNSLKVVSRDDLLNHLQGMNVEVYGRSIDILISRLRQKLGEDTRSPCYIKTVRGQGYRYIGDDS